jgi:hypothetical protein
MQVPHCWIFILLGGEFVEKGSAFDGVGHLGHLAHIDADSLSQGAEGGEALVEGGEGEERKERMRRKKTHVHIIASREEKI